MHALLCLKLDLLTVACAAGEVGELGALDLPTGEDTLVVVMLCDPCLSMTLSLDAYTDSEGHDLQGCPGALP